MNLNNINFVEIAQLISSLAMVVSVIYLAKQISEETIAKKMEFGFNLTDRLYQRYFQSTQMKNSLNFSFRIGLRKALMITNIGE